MTAQLTFDLDNFEDKMAHLRCLKATDMAIVLFDLHKVRKSAEYKLDRDGSSQECYELLDLVFKEIDDLLTEQDINIEELIR